MIIAGRFVVAEMRENKNGRWVRGDFLPYKMCARLLGKVGPYGQKRLPFTIVTECPLPSRPVVAVGTLSEYRLPDTGRLWYTLNVTEYYEKEDPALASFGSFDELAGKLAREDQDTLNALGNRKLQARERLKEILGKGNSFAEQMLEKFGDSAYDRLKTNPWQMIHVIPGFTVKIADQTAEKLGIPLTDENRFRECFRQRLDLFFENRKDTFMSKGDFYALYLMEFASEMEKDEFWEKTTKGEEPLVIETKLGIHPAQFYFDERASLKLMVRASQIKIGDSPELARAEQKAKESMPFPLTGEQEQGLIHAFRSPIHIITGGPGTGKTTLLSAILRKLKILTRADFASPESPVLLAAPTGKAAYRMWEQTGVPAHTIHSAFRIIPDYGCIDRDQAAEALNHVKYLIIDESSMLDTHLFGEMARIMQKMDHIPFLLLVGDVDQLNPVGHGQVFKDLLAYAEKTSPDLVTRLTIGKRQEEGSHIPELAAMLAEGKFPEKAWFEGKPDVKFINLAMADFQNFLVQAVLKPRMGDLEDVQILTPYRNGELPDTVPAINRLAQPYYNPGKEGPSVTVEKPKRLFREGSRVISKVNRTETVINGSLGVITHINAESRDLFVWEITVEFDSGDMVTYPYGELNQLDLAYAITVHAAQGSEYGDVVFCVLRGTQNAEFLNRNLIYTAVTRARERLILLGDYGAFRRAAAVPAPARKTALSIWLEELAKRG